MPVEELRSDLTALAAMSREGAFSPKMMVSQKREYTSGKEEEGNGNDTGAGQQICDCLHPALGCQVHQPRDAGAGWGSPSSSTSLPSVRKPLGKGGKK